MSPVAIGMDILLVGLLLTALFVGLKLNRNLKAMREGQAGFVKAVAELDIAAARAEAGLKALRAASEDVHDELLTRIETARGLINKLDSIADKASAHLVPPTATLAPPTPLLAPRTASPTAPRFQPIPPRPAARGLDDDLFEAAPEPLRQSRPGGRA
jgi:hypothetical protein